MTTNIEVVSGVTTAFTLSRPIADDIVVEEGMWLAPDGTGKMNFPATAGALCYMSLSDTVQPSTIKTGMLWMYMDSGYIKTKQVADTVTPVPGMKLAVGTDGKLIEFVSGTHEHYVAIVDHTDGDYTYIKTV